MESITSDCLLDSHGASSILFFKMQKVSISRQRKWQKAKNAAKLCSLCGKPEEKWGLCSSHVNSAIERRRKKQGVKKAYPPKQKWLQIDWSLPLTVIAKKMSVSAASVRYHLKKAKP
jgi:hypothetical protein